MQPIALTPLTMPFFYAPAWRSDSRAHRRSIMPRRRLMLLALLVGCVSGIVSYAAAATLLADVSAQTAPDAGFLKEVWTAAKAAGFFGTMFMLWQYLRADDERKKLQDERANLFRDVVSITTNATNAIRDVNAGHGTMMATLNLVHPALLRVEALLGKISQDQRER